ncbi:hypothetical protein [Methylobacterium aquaticum]|uniref:hypothetical protein n=1 Tax=Methylobacterium aquaticum TaxID=270351 RepID=UPI00069E77D8|nr:hypothetical protein [Methylobacterium aquaticum]
MAIPFWPDELPKHFEREGFQRTRGDGRLRSKTTTGPGKERLRSRAIVDPFTAKLKVTRAQLRRFDAFLDQDLAGGTLPFLMPDPLGGLPILVKIGEDMPSSVPDHGDNWILALALDKLWTGTIEPGLPVLPAGYAYVTMGGAYVIADGIPVIARVS